jgi:hypothetical protein
LEIKERLTMLLLKRKPKGNETDCEPIFPKVPINEYRKDL